MPATELDSVVGRNVQFIQVETQILRNPSILFYSSIYQQKGTEIECLINLWIAVSETYNGGEKSIYAYYFMMFQLVAITAQLF